VAKAGGGSYVMGGQGEGVTSIEKRLMAWLAPTCTVVQRLVFLGLQNYEGSRDTFSTVQSIKHRVLVDSSV
jgi:hypothetical protein